MFKFVCRLDNGLLKEVLKRLRLYHPPLECLREISEGNAESLGTRSKEFSGLLSDIIINGVSKRTGLGRLNVLDTWVISIIRVPFPMSFRMLDVGGSDGSTTFDTVHFFRDILKVDVKATILEKQLRLHFFRRGCIRYYITHDRCPLLVQIGLLGVLLEETKAKEGYVFNPIVRVTKRFLQRFSFEKYLQDCGDILLVNPMVKISPDIVWLERDLFQFDPALVGKYDFIRCCNVLNCGYFKERQICDALQILARYLKVNGLLLVGRTMEDSSGSLTTASLWIKTCPNLKHVSDLNGGSEVKKLMALVQEE